MNDNELLREYALRNSEPAFDALVKGTMKMMTWLKIKFAVGVGTTMLLAAGVAMVALSADSTSQTGKASEQQTPMLIVPGASVGKVRNGMTIQHTSVWLLIEQ